MIDLRKLEDTLLHSYGIAIDRVVEMKSVIGIVASDNTRWIWKTAGVKDTEWRLAALSEVTTKLERAGVSCAGPVSTLNGRWLVSLTDGHDWGYLQPWFKGRHVNLAVEHERLAAVGALAQLHQKSKGLPLKLLQTLRAPSLSLRLLRKQRNMAEVWPIAKDYLPQLEQIDALIWDGIHGVVRRMSDWSAPGALSFCHRDLAPHNILFDEAESGRIAFVDLDTSGYDEPYLDLMQLCNHSMYFSEVEAGYFHEILTVYKAHADMTYPQERWLLELLRFPDLLIRSTIEWVTQGCPKSGESKVLLAAQKELGRWELLRVEAPWLSVRYPE